MKKLRNSIEYSNKRELVYRTLKEHIVSGYLKPGERFSASEVAQQLGVSRTPVNTAVKLLEEQGLLFTLPNKGFEIKTYSFEDIKEVMRIRLELEKLALSWVIEKASEKELAILKKHSNEMRRTINDRNKEKYYQANRKFHDVLYELARAPRLLDLHHRIWDYEGWYSIQMEAFPEELFLLCDDHEELIDAIQNRNVERAHRIAEEHVQHCIRVLEHNIREFHK